MSLPKAICIAGPTGSGKSRIALELGREFSASIINADSRQVYSDFPIITAQPAPAERKAVPHQLYGIIRADQKLDASAWSEKAASACRDAASHGRIPILAGGTGFYFRAFLEGLADIPDVPKEIGEFFEKAIDEDGPEAWHKRLRKVDPAYADAIHPRDRQRVQRALEVYKTTGKPFSWWHAHSKRRPQGQGAIYLLAPPLESLMPRLSARIDQMINMGAIEEAETAMRKYPDPCLPGWSGIGCSELHEYLRGGTSIEECKKKWLHNTRSYAKRQLTWFRGIKDAIIINKAADILAIEDL